MKKLFLLILALSLVLCLCAAEAEDSLLKSVCDSIDAMEGVHLVYKLRFRTTNTLSEAYAKDGAYCCLQTSTIDGFNIEMRSGTLVVDGAVYSLSPDLDTAIKNTSIPPERFRDNVLMLDSLYESVFLCAGRTDYTTGTRELDGVSYTVQAYPGTGYYAETAFYFDENGSLVHILKAPPESDPDMGEMRFTIELIDGQVDESRFDVSPYNVVEE